MTVNEIRKLRQNDRESCHWGHVGFLLDAHDALQAELEPLDMHRRRNGELLVEVANLRAELAEARKKYKDTALKYSDATERMVEYQNERDQARRELEEAKGDVARLTEEVSRLNQARVNWKWEYENVCKFATDYEQQRDSCGTYCPNYANNNPSVWTKPAPAKEPHGQE